MTRTQTLLVTTAIALIAPLAASAQSSGTKCGPVTFNSRDMTYTSAPCAGDEAPGAVGSSGPTAFGANNSSSMTKAEMKQGVPSGTTYYAPMPAQQAQAVSMGPSPTMAPNMAPNAAPAMSDQCGPSNAATMRDEFGRKYNCRGDRIR